MELLCFELGAPVGDLSQPIAKDRERHDDEVGTRLALLERERGQERDALQSLACHVIRDQGW
jgi:hypothetical protein